MENVWLNLPVKNLEATDQFYKNIGFEPNGKHYKNDQLVSFFSGSNRLIIHFFKEEILEKFIETPICDASKSNEIIITIGSQSEKEIREMAEIIEHSGGTIIKPPQRDQNYFGCTFADPDGHKWNFLLLENDK